MAFNTQEQAIIKAGQQAGKSPSEIRQAVINFRLGVKPPKEEAKKPTYLDEVQEAAGAGLSRIQTGFEQSQTGTANPINALESGLKAGSGFAEIIASPFAPLLKPVQGLFRNVVDKIGGVPAVQEFADTKAGEITSRVAEDVADASAVAGLVSGGRAVPKIGATLSRAAQNTERALQGINETGAVGIERASTSLLDPSKIMQRVARIPKKKQADFEQLAGKSVGQYLVDNGIFGSIDEITEQLASRFKRSRETADDALARLDERFPQTYKPTPVNTALDRLLEREVSVSTPGAPSRDFARVRELRNKYQREGLNMTEINEVKRIYERNVRLDYVKSQNTQGVEQATNLDRAIRTWQFNQAEKLGLKNLPEINKETQLARQLMDDLGREHAGGAGNNAITLTDWIILAELDPTAVASFGLKKTLGSKKVQSEIARRVAGEPLEPDIFPVFENTGQVIDSYGDFIKSIETKR